MEEDYVHFLVQGIPTMPVSRPVKIVKNITAKEIFRRQPEVKKVLRGGPLWTSGHYANTVSQYASEEAIAKDVRNQGKTCEQLHQGEFCENRIAGCG